jgi:hypothetical protein
MAVRSHGGDGDPSQNPFVGHDPANELNEVLLDQWAGWLTALDDAGVVIHFFLYDDSARIWNTGHDVGAAEEAFVRGLVDRFKSLRNLVWCVAEEYAEAYSRPRASNLAAVIRSADDHEHPIAIHQNSGLNFDFPTDPNIDQFAIQYNVGTAAALHAGVVQAFQDAGGSYALNLSEAADWGTGAVARKKSWACAMGGAYVMVLGMDVASTPLSDLEDCGRVVSFFESTSFTDMSPRDDLARAGTRWVLADPGNAYIAYADAAGGSLGLQDLPAGSWDLHWYDCVTGATVDQSNVTTSGGATTWTKPGGLGQEVALYVLSSGMTSIEPANWAKVKAAFR